MKTLVFKQALMFAVASFLSVTHCLLLNYYGYKTELSVATVIIAFALVGIVVTLASLIGNKASMYLVFSTFTIVFSVIIFEEGLTVTAIAVSLFAILFNSFAADKAMTFLISGLSFWRTFSFWLINLTFLAGSIFMVIEDLPGCLFVSAGVIVLPLFISGADLIFQANGDHSLFQKRTIVNY